MRLFRATPRPDQIALIGPKFLVYSKLPCLELLSFPEFKVLVNEAVWFRRRSAHTGIDLRDNQAHGSAVECGAIQL